MNYAQKIGTLFDITNGNVALPRAADQPQRKLANQLPCNSPVDEILKVNTKNT